MNNYITFFLQCDWKTIETLQNITMRIEIFTEIIFYVHSYVTL